MADPKYGVINEVGDLGLGFTELSNKDQKVLKENEQKSSESNKK